MMLQMGPAVYEFQTTRCNYHSKCEDGGIVFVDKITLELSS